MKKLIVFTLFVITYLTCFAQKTTEFGVLLGRSYYLGEINPNKHFGGNNGSFTYGAAFRYNLNQRYSIKATLIRTELSSSDLNSDLPFNLDRQAEFKNELTELAGTIEFNFLPYENGNKDFFFSPYLFVGMSVYRGDPESSINGIDVPDTETPQVTKTAMPFGPGMKLSFARRLNLSIEWGFRRTGNDNIDGLPNRIGDIFEQGKTYDNDWFVVSSFMLTYQLTKKGPCPAYNF